MAIHKTQRPKQNPRSPLKLLLASITAISTFYIANSLLSTNGLFTNSRTSNTIIIKQNGKNQEPYYYIGPQKYLYWGHRIDCPGKHCETCAGLGHQESSLRCALEEAMYLQRTFVMPSRMCLNPIHNNKGILHKPSNSSLEERWAASSCSMDSLYDPEFISNTVPVILDNSKMWHQVLAKSMKLGSRGAAHVEGVSRVDLKENVPYSSILLINRTASPLAWFMECKDRNNRSSIMLPYLFLPSMATKKLRAAAEEIKALLGDYDAIHVRRGDKIKTRKDKSGVIRSLHPHLDRDTRPEFILCRIAKWVPTGRTLFIASNERKEGFFSPLVARYKLAYSSNYSSIIDPIIENNYQLFMLERLIMMGAKTFIRTFKEDTTVLSLTDDPKKNTKVWQIPVYTMDTKDC